jgi:serine/threonine-protein kinase HipA
MLRVVHEAKTVGSLRPVARELEFRYDADWLAHADSFALSPRLPLREAPWRGEEVLFFFANLLPEGPILDTLCRLRRLPRGNVFRLLEAFGLECAGAFEIVPEPGERRPVRKSGYRDYTQQQLWDDLVAIRNHIPLLQSHGELRLSLAGAQNKIPVRWSQGKLYLPVNGAPSTHILKPALQPQESFPDSVINEAFCLRLAAALGIPAPAVTVLTDPEPMLLIERYDRTVEGKNIRRRHQLDFCQLTGTLPDQKYESDGGPGLRELFAGVDTHSARPAVDRLRLVDWVLFNFLVGNADAHAKNLSMLCGSDGRLMLAPAYDLLALGYWDSLSDKMAMAIGGERRPAWLQGRHWQRFCEATRLNVTQLRRRAVELGRAAMREHAQILDGLEASPKLRKHVSAKLAQRAGWIEQRMIGAQGGA